MVNKRLIVIEGPDCVGKSTLASKIKDKLDRESPYGTNTYHATQNTGYQDYIDLMARYIGQDQSLIMDRCWISDRVYSRVMSKPAIMTACERSVLEATMLGIGGVVYVLLPPIEITLSRLVFRGDDYIRPDHMQSLYNGYKEIADEQLYQVVTDPQSLLLTI